MFPARQPHLKQWSRLNRTPPKTRIVTGGPWLPRTTPLSQRPPVTAEQGVRRFAAPARPYNGSTREYFTCPSEKLLSMEATPSICVSFSRKKAS